VTDVAVEPAVAAAARRIGGAHFDDRDPEKISRVSRSSSGRS
jgi:hypothetical protein